MNQNTINVHSIVCKSIKTFTLFQKPSIYAVISVKSPSNPTPQSVKTGVDSNGGENPEFQNQIFTFNLDRPDLSLEIDLMVQGNILMLSGDRLVGKVCVPVNDLVYGGSDGNVRHVSYQVVGTDGKANGVIEFSYEIKSREVRLPPDYANFNPMPRPLYDVVSSPPDGIYPPPVHQYYGVSSPPNEIHPPPHQQYGIYPPPCEQEPMRYYRPPPAATGGGYYQDPGLTGHVAYPPPSIPACCYANPLPRQYGQRYQQDRRLY